MATLSRFDDSYVVEVDDVSTGENFTTIYLNREGLKDGDLKRIFKKMNINVVSNLRVDTSCGVGGDNKTGLCRVYVNGKRAELYNELDFAPKDTRLELAIKRALELPKDEPIEKNTGWSCDGELYYDIDGKTFLIADENQSFEMVRSVLNDDLSDVSSSFLSRVTGIDMRVFDLIVSNPDIEENNKMIQSIFDSVDISINDYTKVFIEEFGRDGVLGEYNNIGIKIDYQDYSIYRVN